MPYIKHPLSHSGPAGYTGKYGLFLRSRPALPKIARAAVVVLRDWAADNNEEDDHAIEPKRRRCQS
jgi:hypothetical protein